MNFSYIFAFFYAIFIALTITFASAVDSSRQQSPVGKTNVAPPKPLSPAKNTLTKENQDRNQRQSVKVMMTNNNNENIDYSDIDYGVDPKQDSAMDNDRWFQDGMKRNSERVQFAQENGNQDHEDTLLFNEDDESEEDEEQEPAKDDKMSGQDKYNRLNVRKEKSHKDNSQTANDFKKYDRNFPSMALNGFNSNSNNRNNLINYDLPKSGNSDANEKSTFESNFLNAKLSSGKDHYGDSFTDMSGCNQCGKKNTDFSQKNVSNSLIGEDLSSAYNEDDRDTFSFGFFNKGAKPPVLLDINDAQRKPTDNKNLDKEWSLLKFSVAKAPDYRKWIPPTTFNKFDKPKNTLDHEADYKLSKVEQDDSEKKTIAPWKWGVFQKRSFKFNPMSVIRLKTSEHLMRRGYGPTLPSSAHVAVQPHFVMQMEENHDSYPNEPFKDKLADQPLDTGEEWIVKSDRNMNEQNDRYKREKEKTSSTATQEKASNKKEALKPADTANDKEKLVKDSNMADNVKAAPLTNADSQNLLSQALTISKEILKSDSQIKALKENYDDDENHIIRKRSIKAFKSPLIGNHNNEAFLADQKHNEDNDEINDKPELLKALDLLEAKTNSHNNLETFNETPEDNLKYHSRVKRSVNPFNSPQYEDVDYEAFLTDLNYNDNINEFNQKPKLLKAHDFLEAMTDSKAFKETSEDHFETHKRRKRSISFEAKQNNAVNEDDVTKQPKKLEEKEELENFCEHQNQTVSQQEPSNASNSTDEDQELEVFCEHAKQITEVNQAAGQQEPSNASNSTDEDQELEVFCEHEKQITEVTKEPSNASNSTHQDQELEDFCEHENRTSTPQTNSVVRVIITFLPTKATELKNSKHLVKTQKASNISFMNLPKEKRSVILLKLLTNLHALTIQDKDKSKDVITSQPVTIKFFKPRPRKRHTHKMNKKSKRGKAFKPHRNYKHSKAYKHRKIRWRKTAPSFTEGNKHKNLHHKPQRSIGERKDF